MVLEDPGGGAEAESEHAHDDDGIEVEADGDGVQLRQRAADEGDDQCGDEQSDEDWGGGANANFETLGSNKREGLEQIFGQVAMAGRHPGEGAEQRIDHLAMAADEKEDGGG